VSNLESLFIGRIYTKADLGYFSQARKLEGYLIQTPNAIVQKVTYPTLSTILDDKERLKKGYRKLLEVNMFFTMPLSFFVFAIPENIIYTILGGQWMVAASYLRIWIVIGLLVGLYSIFMNIFLVLGESRYLLKISLLRQGLRVISVVLLIRISIMSMLYGILIVTIISTILYTYSGRKLLNYKLVEMIKDISPSFLVSSFSALVVYLSTRYFLTSFSTQNFILQSVLMIVIYIGTMMLIKNPACIEVREIFYNLIKKSK
jgi:O-antigen/teichoic acid export membrane protein